MARFSRIKLTDQPSVYHVCSRTALDGLPFKADDKNIFVKLIQHFSLIYFTEILGFCVMDNHFHILLRMHTKSEFSDEEIEKRHALYYGKDCFFDKRQIPLLRQRWENLSEFMRDLKSAFTRDYNKKYDRRGTLWGERFKSTLVQDGAPLLNCLAYIDLNPVRAGIVKRPENYRWNSLNYLMRNVDSSTWLSLNTGSSQYEGISLGEKIEKYRTFLYEASALADLHKNSSKKERKRYQRFSKHHRFLNRTRYFSDSLIIGSLEFVRTYCRKFKHFFATAHEKTPVKIPGLFEIFALREIR